MGGAEEEHRLERQGALIFAIIANTRVGGAQKEEGNQGRWRHKKICGSRPDPPTLCGGTRNNDKDCRRRPASPKDPFDLLVAHRISCTKKLFSIEDLFRFNGDSNKIDLLSAYCAVSGSRPFESLAERTALF